MEPDNSKNECLVPFFCIARDLDDYRANESNSRSVQRLSKGFNKAAILCPGLPFFLHIFIRISLLHKARPAGHHFLRQCMILIGHRAPATVQSSEGVPQFRRVESTVITTRQIMAEFIEIYRKILLPAGICKRDGSSEEPTRSVGSTLRNKQIILGNTHQIGDMGLSLIHI